MFYKYQRYQLNKYQTRLNEINVQIFEVVVDQLAVLHREVDVGLGGGSVILLRHLGQIRWHNLQLANLRHKYYKITDKTEICFTNVYLLYLFRFGQLMTILNYSKVEVCLKAYFVGERTLLSTEILKYLLWIYICCK